MEHSHMQVHVMNIFNKEIVSMEHISSDQIKKRDQNDVERNYSERFMFLKLLIFVFRMLNYMHFKSNVNSLTPKVELF